MTTERASPLAYVVGYDSEVNPFYNNATTPGTEGAISDVSRGITDIDIV